MDLAALFKQLFLFSRLEAEEIEQFSTIMREKILVAGRHRALWGLC